MTTNDHGTPEGRPVSTGHDWHPHSILEGVQLRYLDVAADATWELDTWKIGGVGVSWKDMFGVQAHGIGSWTGNDLLDAARHRFEGAGGLAGDWEASESHNHSTNWRGGSRAS